MTRRKVPNRWRFEFEIVPAVPMRSRRSQPKGHVGSVEPIYNAIREKFERLLLECQTEGLINMRDYWPTLRRFRVHNDEYTVTAAWRRQRESGESDTGS